jgi:putative membrane protein
MPADGKMFIDYVEMMLINMVGGLFILAAYLVKGFDDPHQKRWAPAFAMPGFVGLITGLYIIFTWPLPGSYNAPYGELSVLLGVLFLGAAWALAKEWDLLMLGIYAFFAGVAAIIVGIRIISLKMTLMPVLSGIGFMLTGFGGVCACLVLSLRRNRSLRLIGALVIAAAALIWASIGYMEIWGHLASFAKYVPPTMR